MLSTLAQALGLGGSKQASAEAGEATQLKPVRLPLVHNGHEGTWKVVLTVGGKEFQVILDTCSDSLLITGEGCDSCERAQGLWDMHRGRATGERSTITFFSQSNQVEWRTDRLHIATQHVPLEFGVITQNTSLMVNGGTLPGRSVFGLGIAQKGGKLLHWKPHACVSQLFTSGLFAPYYSINIDESGDKGELTLGQSLDGVKGWVPLVKDTELSYLDYSAEWVIPVARCVVVSHAGLPLVELPVKYARVDVGNTWLSMPTSYGRIEDLPGAAGIRFVFSDGFSLFFPVESYTGPIEVANQTGYGGLAHDDSLDRYPQDAVTCVIGNELLKGMQMVVDLKELKLGFGGGNCAVLPTSAIARTGPSLKDVYIAPFEGYF